MKKSFTILLQVLAVNLRHPVQSSLALSSLYGKTTRNIATQVLQGTGPPLVNLDEYNLPIDVIEEGWTVNFVTKSIETNGSVELRAKNSVEHYVDTILVSFPRKDGAGLGVELAELAGGRSDGIGITIITGLVEGGSAEGSSIYPGDCISSVSLIRRQKSKMNGKIVSEKEEQFVVATECMDFLTTVEAIKSLPEAKDGFEDSFVLKVNRLRRKPRVKVNLQYPPEQNEKDAVIEMYAGENLRQGMLIRGVKLNDPLAQRFDTKQGGNCGAGGLCRTCSVAIVSGDDVLNPQRVAEKQMLQDNPRWRLACKAVVGYGMKEGEITVRVNPRQW
jgi:ferredoxin